MIVPENTDTFLGKPVRDFIDGQQITDVNDTVYRLRIPWEVYDIATNQATESAGGLWNTIKRLFKLSDQQPKSEEERPGRERPFLQLLHQFVTDPAAPQVPALIIGDCGGAGELNDSCFVIDALVTIADKLPNLRALFFGDIAADESEISWIEQCDFSPLWQAYPQLEHLQIRGTNNLVLGKLQLANLRHSSSNPAVCRPASFNLSGNPTFRTCNIWNSGWAIHHMAPILP